MSTEDLLRPRYKIIADWPKCPFPVNSIVFPSLLKNRKTKQMEYVIRLPDFDFQKPENYPHLFRKLEWWEERSVDDMPEYVKLAALNRVEKVRFDMETTSKYFMYIEGDALGLPYAIENWIPADTTDYNNYISQHTDKNICGE